MSSGNIRLEKAQKRALFRRFLYDGRNDRRRDCAFSDLLDLELMLNKKYSSLKVDPSSILSKPIDVLHRAFCSAARYPWKLLNL